MKLPLMIASLRRPPCKGGALFRRVSSDIREWLLQGDGQDPAFLKHHSDGEKWEESGGAVQRVACHPLESIVYRLQWPEKRKEKGEKRRSGILSCPETLRQDLEQKLEMPEGP